MLRNKKYVYGGDALMIPGHMNFGLYMLNKCKEFNEHIALIAADTGETMTYSQLVKLAIDIALSLTRIGVKSGDVVCVFSEKRLEYFPTLLGVVCAGATFLAGDVSHRRERVLHRIEIAKPKIIFCSQYTYNIHKETLKKAPFIKHIIIYNDKRTDEISFDDFLSPPLVQDYEDFEPIPVEGWKAMALLLFSTGTTGLPKAAPMTHVNLISVYQNGTLESFLSGKPLLATREFYLTYGLLHSLAAVLAGAPLVFTNKSGVEDYLSIVEKLKVTTLQMVPPTISEIVKTPALHKYSVSSVKAIVTTSIPTGGELLTATRSCFESLRDVIQIYGMTEAGCVTLHKGLDVKMSSVGRPQAGTVFKVVDIATRQPLGPNERGEICFKSLTLMSGYLGDTTLDYMDEEGFFKSGDVGYYDQDKYFYVVDRIKDMIKYKGASYSPAELESILLLHPDVMEAGIAPAPDEILGEILVAFVVLKPGGEVNETLLMSYFAERIAQVELGGIHFVTSLPRGAGEKLDRKTLKSLLSK